MEKKNNTSSIVVPDVEEAKSAETSDLVPFVATVTIDKKEYMKLSMFNMRRFLGAKQIILYLILLAAGLALFFAWGIWLFLLLFAVVNVLVVVAVGTFYATARTGFTYEFIKTGVTGQRLTFDESGILAENLDKEGKPVFEELHEKAQIDKLAVTKDRIFVFRSTAIYYYIRKEDVADDRFFELQDFLRTTYPPTTFQLKKRIKQYPGYNNK